MSHTALFLQASYHDKKEADDSDCFDSECSSWMDIYIFREKAGISPASEARYGSLPSSTIFCNTDASWKSQSAGLAWIFTNQEGSEVASKGISLHHVSSPCMAEALAIRGALLNAASLDYHNICLRSDSQELIWAINGRK
ncbi:hypothetical protein Bca4012_072012 [Brassica carinata]